MIFFLLYWAMTLFSFDDDQEEVIEFVDSFFFYIFSLCIFYLFYKHSVHYFSFLGPSNPKGRSTNFISQFQADLIDTFSVLMRFYILLFRMNVYDTLEDFFDSYYIFIGDFDDDEYFQELFLSIHGTILFTLDNHDDRSFLLEDESDFMSDFFYMYYVAWGKLFYFLAYMIEEGARVSLALYITFLIIFEVHSSNYSYKEDSFVWADRKSVV